MENIRHSIEKLEIDVASSAKDRKSHIRYNRNRMKEKTEVREVYIGTTTFTQQIKGSPKRKEKWKREAKIV